MQQADLSAFDRLLDRLDGVRRNGHTATARCPTHKDGTPSLSITKMEGQVLISCTHAAIHAIAAIDWTMGDLFDDRKGATYDWEDGRRMRRTYDGDGKKRFTQSGHTNGARTTLYRLAEVQKAAQSNEPILLVECEKDVLAGNFHKADPTPLYGAQIIVIAHDDESGEKWARQVVAALDGKASALHGGRIMQRLAEPRLAPTG